MRICINPSDLCLVVEERKTKLPRGRAQGMNLGWEVGHIPRSVCDGGRVLQRPVAMCYIFSCPHCWGMDRKFVSSSVLHVTTVSFQIIIEKTRTFIIHHLSRRSGVCDIHNSYVHKAWNVDEQTTTR